MILAVVIIIYFDISQIGIFPGNLFEQTAVKLKCWLKKQRTWLADSFCGFLFMINNFLMFCILNRSSRAVKFNNLFHYRPCE